MSAIHAVVEDFTNRLFDDERVNSWFAHTASTPQRKADYRAKLESFVCQATDGPCKYTGKDMFSAHAGRGITDAALQAVVDDLVATLDSMKVPEREKQQLLSLLAPIKAAADENKQ